jgi:outer membrane protein OmpA-like peptidoglycan-associated protein
MAQTKKSEWSTDWDDFDSLKEMGRDEVIHIVEDGDELWLLSLEYYGTRHQWKKIVDANPGINSRKLKPGQRLTIPFGDYKPSKKTRSPASTKKIAAAQKKAYKEQNKKVRKGKIIFQTPNGKEVTIKADNKQFEMIKDSVKTGQVTYVTKEGIKFPIEYAHRAPAGVLNPGNEKRGKFDPPFDFAGGGEAAKITFISSSGDHVQFNVDDSGEQEAVIRETLKRGRILYMSSNNKKYEYDFKDHGYGHNPGEENKEFAFLREDYEELKEEYLKVKEKNIRLEETMVIDQERSSNLKNWTMEKRLLKNELEKLKDAYAKADTQLKNMTSAPSYHVPSMLSYNEDQVMREKTRILNKKLWVYKNKDFNKCVMHFPPTEAKKETMFKEFVLYLNETFGTDKVFGDASEGRVIFEVPGNAVYGIDSPLLSPKYHGIMAKISNYLEHLPVTAMHITGHTRFKQVQNDKGKYVDGDVFTLKQSMAMQDHFINELGWRPQLVSAGTMGYLSTQKKREKKFDIAISFEQVKQPGRSIASVLASSDVLRNIADDIYQQINEPKYGKVKVTDEGLELHMARKYFFAENGMSLTDDGKKKLKVIMNMFSMVNDAKFQISWVPGMLEKDEKRNTMNALVGTNRLKKYLEENYGWSKDRIEISYAKRQKNLVDSYDYTEDAYNKRIIFKLVPLSLNVRQLGDIK